MPQPSEGRNGLERSNSQVKETKSDQEGEKCKRFHVVVPIQVVRAQYVNCPSIVLGGVSPAPAGGLEPPNYSLSGWARMLRMAPTIGAPTPHATPAGQPPHCAT